MRTGIPGGPSLGEIRDSVDSGGGNAGNDPNDSGGGGGGGGGGDPGTGLPGSGGVIIDDRRDDEDDLTTPGEDPNWSDREGDSDGTTTYDPTEGGDPTDGTTGVVSGPGGDTVVDVGGAGDGEDVGQSPRVAAMEAEIERLRDQLSSFEVPTPASSTSSIGGTLVGAVGVLVGLAALAAATLGGDNGAAG
jgi:hypothetical protein